MKRHFLKYCALLLAILIFASVCLVACQNNNQNVSTTTTSTTDKKDDPKPLPGDEYVLPKEEGHNQITFYWNYNEDLSSADIWVWWDGKEGSGYLMHECAYGGKAVINVPEGITEVGFITRYNCSEPGGSSWGNATKDYDGDRFAVIEGEETVIYLKKGDASQYTSDDGGKTLTMLKKFTLAGIIDFNTIKYNITPAATISNINDVKITQDGKDIKIIAISSLNKKLTSGKITVDEKLDISKPYEIEIAGYGKKSVVPTEIFDTDEFIANYTYDGDDLGAYIHGNDTTFKVWAPTASKVVLNLYKDDVNRDIEMTLGEKGVWAHTEKDCGHGTYYTYTVTTSVGTQIATDPYAKAAGVNGNQSMVVDLSLTDPAGWDEDQSFSTGIKTYSDAIIWEVHVRDFSNKIETSQYKGKYLAFTERGLVNSHGVPVGVDYLVELGITHVHLLPVYDYATVDEANPDSEFNWGYDPKNYNVPEGSYSTDPYNGEVRINEFKQMVMGLHDAGIGVIMDVVYNHTYDANSSFNKIVPYYYYRYTSTGVNSSASGCGNDTASERYMYGKFMVDSVKYWATEYNLDGFRFDLMGLHDLETMKKVEAAVHEINNEALIYGEGWTMGSTIDGTPQANQSNISQITPTGDAIGSIAVFNDVIRDGLKGSVFDKLSTGYISGSGSSNEYSIQFGISGSDLPSKGWTVKDSMVINYMSAHDNHTLWDKLTISCPTATDEEKAAMNKLGAAIIMISKGTPFMQAGEEMLRTKDGDENSYKSSDEINNIDWEALEPGSLVYETMQYYKGLFAMRKAYNIFHSESDVTVTFKKLGLGRLEVTFDDQNGNRALVIINPTNLTFNHTLDGEWKLIGTESQAGADVIDLRSGDITIEKYGINIFVN